MLKRRQLIRYTTIGLLSASWTTFRSGWDFYQAETRSNQPSKPENQSLSIQWFGHTCFLFTGGGTRILVNPFQRIGCTKGYRDVSTLNPDLVLISSRLLDEGVVDGFKGNPGLLYEPGVYKFNEMRVEGIKIDKDREKGRRFGSNVSWLWKQAGIKILHLGALAGKVGIEQQILMGRPDILLIPVGGGVKAYQPEEAKKVIELLKPKMVIPTHYKTKAADENACDLEGIEPFLSVMNGLKVRQLNGDTLTLNLNDLTNNDPLINIFAYQF